MNPTPLSPASATRREFLSSGVKLGAALIATPYLARASAPAGAGGSRTLNVALIGCGEQGRVLIRYSGTQNMCRVMVEGPTKEITEKHCKELSEIVKKALS